MSGTRLPKETRYYERESDDFDNTKSASVGAAWHYDDRAPMRRALRAVCYFGIAAPIAFTYSKIVKRERFIGKEKLTATKGRGIFVYSNHTCAAGDAFTPNVFLLPRVSDIVVSAKNLSLPVLGKLVPHLGGIPVPTERSGLKPFTERIGSSIGRGRAVVIYPEAHLWEGFGGIRPFSDTSFTYPVRLDAPCYALTRVYRRRGRSYASYMYLDGPFYPDSNLDAAKARKKLCREIRAAMEARAATSDVAVIEYKRKE